MNLLRDGQQSWLNATGPTAGKSRAEMGPQDMILVLCSQQSETHQDTAQQGFRVCSALSRGTTYSKTMLTLEPYLYLKVKACLMPQQLKTLALS